MNVFGLCIAEGVTEEPGEQHSERQEVTERDPLCNHAREEHGDRVADEETRVKEAEKGRGVWAICAKGLSVNCSACGLGETHQTVHNRTTYRHRELSAR